MFTVICVIHSSTNRQSCQPQHAAERTDLTLSDGGAVATMRVNGGVYVFRTTASTVVMRSGCHFVQKVSDHGMMFGMTRSG